MSKLGRRESSNNEPRRLDGPEPVKIKKTLNQKIYLEEKNIQNDFKLKFSAQIYNVIQKRQREGLMESTFVNETEISNQCITIFMKTFLVTAQ